MYAQSIIMGAILLAAPGLAIPYNQPPSYGQPASYGQPPSYGRPGSYSSPSSTQVKPTGSAHSTGYGSSSSSSSTSKTRYFSSSSTNVKPTSATRYTPKYPAGNSTAPYSTGGMTYSSYSTYLTTTVTSDRTTTQTKTITLTMPNGSGSSSYSAPSDTATSPAGTGSSSYSAPSSIATSPADTGCGAPETVTVTSKQRVYITVYPSSSTESAPLSSSSPTYKSFYSSKSSASYGFPNGTSIRPTGTGTGYTRSTKATIPIYGTGHSSNTYVKPTTTSRSTPAGYSSSSTSVDATKPENTYGYNSYARSADKHNHKKGHKALHRVLSQSKAATTSSNGKRGVLYNDPNMVGPFDGASQCTWAYNWGSSSGGLTGKFDYVPMLWGDAPEHSDHWDSDVNTAIAAGATHVLAFNEPDHPEQANIGYEQAAASFKQYMSPLQGRVKIGSPAVTNGAAPMGLAYLESFMGACSDCPIDFVAVHWYDVASNTQYFKDHVTEAHQKTGKPVWVTEFGASGSPDEIDAFLKDVMPWMDSQDFVERYAYFMASDGNLVSGTSLSTYGSTYADFSG